MIFLSIRTDAVDNCKLQLCANTRDMCIGGGRGCVGSELRKRWMDGHELPLLLRFPSNTYTYASILTKKQSPNTWSTCRISLTQRILSAILTYIEPSGAVIKPSPCPPATYLCSVFHMKMSHRIRWRLINVSTKYSLYTTQPDLFEKINQLQPEQTTFITDWGC